LERKLKSLMAMRYFPFLLCITVATFITGPIFTPAV
jgi:hypothetical protein